MKNNTITIAVVVAGLAVFGLFALLSYGEANDKSVPAMGPGYGNNNEVSAENCVSQDCLAIEDLEYPVSELQASVVDALDAAIDDEYKARATYEAVIDTLGSTRPFSMIIRAEEQHISSLKALYDKYGLPVPEDPYTNVTVADTRAANCAIGVQAEIDNAALYREELLPAVAEYQDITDVFIRLMDASQDKHLPAFERCAG